LDLGECLGSHMNEGSGSCNIVAFGSVCLNCGLTGLAGEWEKVGTGGDLREGGLVGL
jgi:hypothetical protein